MQVVLKVCSSVLLIHYEVMNVCTQEDTDREREREVEKKGGRRCREGGRDGDITVYVYVTAGL